MKIAVVLKQAKRKNGATRVSLNILKLLVDRGHEVELICEKLNKKLLPSPLIKTKKIFTYFTSGMRQRRIFESKVEAYIKKQAFDFVISHGDLHKSDVIFIHNSLELAKELLGENNNKVLDPLSERQKNIIQNNNYKLLVANSEFMKKDILKRYNISSKKIIINYPSFDKNEFSPKKLSAKKIRENLKLKDTKFMIGLITSGEPKIRGADTLVKAYSLLTEEVKNKVNVLIIGKNMKKKLFGLIPDNEKDNYIFLDFIKGVAPYYQALDLFVLPARIETFGCSVLEAVVSSTPALLSKNVGALEILPKELQDLAVESDSPKALAKQIEALYQANFKLDCFYHHDEFCMLNEDKNRANELYQNLKQVDSRL